MSTTRDENIMAGLTEVAREVFMDEDIVLTHETWADDIVGWSSIALVELLIGAQERFGVTLSAEETDGLTSIGGLADVIAHKMPA